MVTAPSADRLMAPSLVDNAAVCTVRSPPEIIVIGSTNAAPSTTRFPLAASPMVIEEKPSLRAAMSVSVRSNVCPAPEPIPIVAAAVACLRVKVPVPMMLLAPPLKSSSSDAKLMLPPPVAVRVLEATMPVVAVRSKLAALAAPENVVVPAPAV